MNRLELEEKCKEIRRNIVKMIAGAGSGHPGGSLSIVEILAVLYFEKMNIDPADPKKKDRDYLVLSKGHSAPALYATLAERGFFDKAEFANFRQLGSILQGHPDVKKCPGVDVSTGSLGQGISIAAGIALGAKTAGLPSKVYAICGDGELQEGQVWEASMAAAHYKLDNFTVFVDNNGLQIDGANDDVMSLGDLAAKFTSFGYEVIQIDGNDIEQVEKAIDAPANGKPKLILCKTVKGKGVSFMENQSGWHGKAPNAEQLAQALKELED